METLKITERVGHFNLLNPSEESCSMHFSYTNGEEKKYLNLSFSEGQGYEGYASAEDAAWIIGEWDKSMFISTRRKEAQEFKDFILTRAAGIDAGNKEAHYADLLKKREKIDEEIAAIERAQPKEA